jgi:hypothetical protein
VGSQSYRVSEIKPGYLEFGAAAGAIPKPAPGGNMRVVITATAAIAGTLPAFNAGDVGSSMTIVSAGTLAHKLDSFSPPRIDGSNGTVTLGTQIGSSVSLLVNSTGSIITTGLRGNGAAVS